MSVTATESFFQEAFNQALKDAEKPEPWYVCLMQDAPYYGGPEEGGWWGTDTVCCAYQEFPSKGTAEKAKAAVLKLAAQLSGEARTRAGDHCLRQLAWLEERGLDADFFPEPDGPEVYHVVVCRGIPTPQYGSRHYE